DLGDQIHAPLISDPAVECTYAMVRHPRPLAAVRALVAAYDDANRLTDRELELLFDLILTRLAMSIVMAAWQHAAAPGNDYLLVSQNGVWDLLRKLAGENRHLAHFQLRDACGREPNPASRRVVGWIESASR